MARLVGGLVGGMTDRGPRIPAPRTDGSEWEQQAPDWSAPTAAPRQQPSAFQAGGDALQSVVNSLLQSGDGWTGPGTAAPLDQQNYTPGYGVSGPGEAAPLGQWNYTRPGRESSRRESSGPFSAPTQFPDGAAPPLSGGPLDPEGGPYQGGQPRPGAPPLGGGTLPEGGTGPLQPPTAPPAPPEYGPGSPGYDQGWRFTVPKAYGSGSETDQARYLAALKAIYAANPDIGDWYEENPIYGAETDEQSYARYLAALKAIYDANPSIGDYYDANPVGGQAGTPDAALDYIWSKRPDLAVFYKQNGWNVDSPEDQRKAVQDWLSMSDQQIVTGAGRDPLKVAQALGMTKAAEASWYQQMTDWLANNPTQDPWLAKYGADQASIRKYARQMGWYDEPGASADDWYGQMQDWSANNPTNDPWLQQYGNSQAALVRYAKQMGWYKDTSSASARDVPISQGGIWVRPRLSGNIQEIASRYGVDPATVTSQGAGGWYWFPVRVGQEWDMADQLSREGAVAYATPDLQPTDRDFSNLPVASRGYQSYLYLHPDAGAWDAADKTYEGPQNGQPRQTGARWAVPRGNW